MAKKVCRVCGKEYPFCKTPNPNNDFRWQDVACSYECGAIYLDMILKSRECGGEASTSEPPVAVKKRSKKSPTAKVVEEVVPEEEAMDLSVIDSEDEDEDEELFFNEDDDLDGEVEEIEME